MIGKLRRVARTLLPYSFVQGLHYFRHHGDYLMVPKGDSHVVLPRGSLEYAEDNLYTYNTAPFLGDQRFLRAYEAGARTNSWHGLPIRWRVHIACWAGLHASRLGGDFVECGVNRGGLARAIVEYTNFSSLKKRFFLVDTFAGLVPDCLNEVEKEKGMLDLFAYYRDNSKEDVCETFASYPQVHVIEGAVPDVLANVPTKEVAFVSLDMNCTLPEISAAEHFWDQLVPGGIILLDDYTQRLHSEQQVAFDAFALERGVAVLALPTGQGILLKS